MKMDAITEGWWLAREEKKRKDVSQSVTNWKDLKEDELQKNNESEDSL